MRAILAGTKTLARGNSAERPRGIPSHAIHREELAGNPRRYLALRAIYPETPQTASCTTLLLHLLAYVVRHIVTLGDHA
jgi:hypothetical protein